MTEPHPAKLARIVSEPPQVIIRIQTEDGALHEFAINKDQLLNINADSANILVAK